MSRRPVRAGLLLSFAGALGGCVSLLPAQPPVQLYQFGGAPTDAPAPGPAVAVGRGQGGAPGVVLAEVSFPRSALGDGILTTHGEEAAYVAGGRWLEPAVQLFQEAAERTFRARGVRLVARSELGAASALLRLDVDRFEARYEGAGAAPVAVVSLHATLTRADGRVLLQQAFAVRRPAAADRVSAVVAAYDAAAAAVLAGAADWTAAEAPALARGLDPSSLPAAIPQHPVRGLDTSAPPA